MPVRVQLHERRAFPGRHRLPFGVTGPSPLLTPAEKTFSLKVTQYPDETAVKTAIGQAKICGALIPATTRARRAP